MLYSVSPDLYRETAGRLAEAIGSEGYFSGSLSFPFDGLDCRLTASVIVYRGRVSYPESETNAIRDLVPVWWEFHTVGEEGERLNDFSFSELRRWL